MDSFPTLPLPLRLPGHGAVDAAFVGGLNADREDLNLRRVFFLMRKRTGNWGADTPRSPDFKVGLPGKALKYVT